MSYLLPLFHYSLFHLLLPHSSSPPFFPHRNSCDADSIASTVSSTVLTTCLSDVKYARSHGKCIEITRLRSQPQAPSASKGRGE